jgi:hypothetical protein
MKSFNEWINKKYDFDNIKYCESSLIGMLSTPSITWFIITSYRKLNADGSERKKEENINRNLELRSKLNSMKMGVHQLIGHWRECKDKETSCQDCPESDKVDVVEKSYFVPLPKEMDIDKFKELLLSLSDEYQQDAIIFNDGKDINLLFPKGGQTSLGKYLNLNQIEQAYSQHILKQNVPFVFEGFMQYHGNYARQGAYIHGLKLPSMDEAFKVIKARTLN